MGWRDDDLWERVDHPQDAGDRELRDRVLNPRSDADHALADSYRRRSDDGGRSSGEAEAGSGVRSFIRRHAGYDRDPDPGHDAVTVATGEAEVRRPAPPRRTAVPAPGDRDPNPLRPKIGRRRSR